jgi:hypothetical protein
MSKFSDEQGEVNINRFQRASANPLSIKSIGRCRHAHGRAFHDLKADAWPLSRDVPHWRSEARVARINAADAYAPSMRPRIDVPGIYSKAHHALPETMDGVPPLPLPDVCPVTLDELLNED